MPRFGGRPGGGPPRTLANSALSAAKAGWSCPSISSEPEERQVELRAVVEQFGAIDEPWPLRGWGEAGAPARPTKLNVATRTLFSFLEILAPESQPR